MVENQPDRTNAAPVAGGQESEPLPPIPDGGLAEVMPGWLREPPATAGPARAEITARPAGSPETDLDPAGFISETDLPEWLRQLGPTGSPVPLAGASPGQARPPSLPSSTRTARASTTWRSATGPTAAVPAKTDGDRRVDSQPAPNPATDPAIPPRREPEPTRPLIIAPTGRRTPPPEVSPVDANRGVIITGIVLVLITVAVIIYLFATGVL